MLLLSKSLQRQTITIFSCGLTNFVFGLGFGWIAPALDHLQSDASSFLINDEELSWVASTYFALEITSSIAAGFFSGFIGRKPLITIGTFLQALSWVILIVAKSAAMVVLSRAILGIAAGIFDITWSIYLGEITTPSERGIFGSIMIVLVIGGQMIEFLLSLFVSHVYLSVIPLAISVVSFAMCFLMVEAPPFLVTRGENAYALSNLAWLRGKDDVKEVQLEFNEMKDYIESVQQRRHVLWNVLKHPMGNRVYIFCVLIFALAQLTGYMVVVSYQAVVLAQYDDIPDGKYVTLIFGISIFVFVLVNIGFIETIGRRTLLLVGFGACAIIQISTAFSIYTQDHNIFNVSFIPKIIVVLFNFYGIIFIMCILPTIFVLKSELFPQEMKTVGSVSSTVSNAFAEFVVTKFFVFVWYKYGLYVNFAFYAIVDIVSVIYVYLLIPETKGKSLVQIQNELAIRKSSEVGFSPSSTTSRSRYVSSPE
ncbi:solute carrier family 2, facilitated glucose transporter member 6-like [Planococcus citri]|uniref:solute carrier family 2, facilitated glucose transporter member 6-like n=1 Tax=Planococcus citri TaxID=170843 RepID=UPI0031F7F874